jgi:putative hydrolase of the HAD superfamily
LGVKLHKGEMVEPSSFPRLADVQHPRYNSMITPHAVLFDLDDTLADRQAGLQNYAMRLHVDFAEALRPCVAAQVHEALVLADDFGSVTQAEVLSASPLWREPPGSQALFDHWNTRFGEAAAPFTGAVELLSNLRDLGIKLGLVTNGRSAMQRSKVAALGVEPLLDVIIVSSEVGLRKPQSAIFELALNTLGCGAREAWFVGDHPSQDIQGAIDAGLRAFWVKTGMSFAEANVPGTHLASLSELLQYLN